MTQTPAAVLDALRQQQIETPSWGYANSGTRFKVFAQQGVPRTPEEKLDDAATVHRLTGVAPSVSLHIPWDKVEDYDALAKHAADRGVRIGAINANVFQDDDYKLGSVTNPDPAVRRKATDHLLECVDIADLTGSRDLKLWFSDGTNYPGQDDLPARQDRLAEALRTVYDRLGDDQRHPAGVQALRAGVLRHRRPGLGHVLRALPRARAARRRSSSTPATTRRAPTSSSSWRSCCGRQKLGGVRLQQPLLRRRRPHGRVRRPVPALPDHARDRPRPTRCGRRRGSTSCSTSATTSSRRSRRSSARS